ncbi:lysophosphatidic acid receptor 6 [Triplophysa rosa]|uniref:Lysophosphatidic acid receptor 6-like n=1 Tax=Triplophysa rosa TaxID=992332 RepID=A0A9W7X5H6_TRIRA|nr:lysophosphatidic acid receptor 6 [Triplophysa rosa]XP_057192645.1 lysophosphatidic acid receptor 6 [Triplophysa rosa]XP_057192654.1 lysophosphatidic acid receptor 6 [Triplophysa rosa]KAI7814492.1 putative lysophosphatidic acid receptor 6-like [Triplophysa rosa]
MFNSTVSQSCQNTTQGEQDVIFVAVYAVVFIAGLALNLTALWIFFSNSKSRSHTTVYMIHLAFADVLLICTLPLRIYYHGGFKDLHQKICEFAGLILLANMYGSIFLLTSISFDRCVAVCFPMSSRVREGRKKAWCICLGIWVLTIGTSWPIYFRKVLLHHSSNTTMQKHCFGSFPVYATQTATLISTLIVGFGIPLTVMILSSWGLVRAISKSNAAQTSDLVDSKRIKRMITTNLAIFLFCFLPYHLMLLILYVYTSSESIPCSLVPAYHYSLMIACLNAVLDPLAYYFTTETFRRKMDVGAVRKIWQMNSHSSDGNNRPRAPLNT